LNYNFVITTNVPNIMKTTKELWHFCAQCTYCHSSCENIQTLQISITAHAKKHLCPL